MTKQTPPKSIDEAVHRALMTGPLSGASDRVTTEVQSFLKVENNRKKLTWIAGAMVLASVFLCIYFCAPTNWSALAYCSDKCASIHASSYSIEHGQCACWFQYKK